MIYMVSFEEEMKNGMEEAKKFDEKLAAAIALGKLKFVEDTEEEEKEVTPKDVLNKYTNLDLELQKAYIEETEFIEKYKEVFSKYQEIQDKIKSIQEEQSDVKEELKDKMREYNLNEESNDRFIAKYTAPYSKKNFDTKQFYEDYAPDTAMYKKYVKTINVKDSVKINEVKKK